MKKDLFAVSIIAFLLLFVCTGTKIQSPDEYYLTHIDDIREDSETVFLTVRCDTVLKNWDTLDPALRYERYVPQDGMILPRTEYVLRDGDTVYDILDRAMRHNQIPLVCMFSQNYSSVYVQGINHLFEFSCGELSGWTYMVNGVFPNYGCSRYELQNGDEIVWCYTCDLGRDVGCEWGEEP